MYCFHLQHFFRTYWPLKIHAVYTFKMQNVRIQLPCDAAWYARRIKTLSLKMLASHYWYVTLWGRAPLDKLVEKFLAFYGTQRLITMFRTAHILSVLCARWIQLFHTHPISVSPVSVFSPLYSKWCLSVGFPHQNAFLPPPCVPYDLPNSPLHYMITQIIFGEEHRSWSFSLCSLLESPVPFSLS
jgi:hypothetical protein